MTHQDLIELSKMKFKACPTSFIQDSAIKKIKKGQNYDSSPVQEYNNQENKPLIYSITKDKTNTVLNEFNSKLYSQNTDSLLPQYTLMNYTTGPLFTSMYQNYTYHPSYSGYSYLEYTYNDNGNNNPTTQSKTCFPSYFNPRTASNMPHKEKVNNWIENIPIFELEDGIFETDCYNIDYSMDWEEQEFESSLHNYNNNHNKSSFATLDDILQLQSKKLDTLVRKMYTLESEPPNLDNDILTSESDYL